MERQEDIKEQYAEEWESLGSEYPRFASLHLAQQYILMESASRGDRIVIDRMSSLIDRAVVPLLHGYWRRRSDEVATFVALFGTGIELIDCIAEAKDPGDCFELEVERDWFDDPFDYASHLPDRPDPPL